MIDQLESLFKAVAPYLSQITALLTIVGTIFLALYKVKTDRLNKRDELQFGELLKTRNAEIKAYSIAMSMAFSKLNMVFVVLIDDMDDIRRLRNEFLEAYDNLVKAFVGLHFYIPAEDEKKLEAFHNVIVEVVSEATVLLSSYISGRIKSRSEFEVKVMAFKTRMNEAAAAFDEVTPAVQSMFRKYTGVQS